MAKKIPEWKECAMERAGFHYGKTDLERLGLFVEMQCMNGKGYVSPHGVKFMDHQAKGPQIMPEYPKSRCATQEGYFREKYERIFEREGETNMFKRRLQEMMASAKKNVSQQVFLPSSKPKLHSTPGDIYGTFTEKLEAFSPKPRDVKKKPKEPPNCLVSAGKKGGYGYADITLDKYPEHSAEKYDAGPIQYAKNFVVHKKLIRAGPLLSAVHPVPYFDKNPYFTEKIQSIYKIPPKEKDLTYGPSTFLPPSPGKKPGGNKDGCFDKYPEHSADKYLTPTQIKNFVPPPRKGKKAKMEEKAGTFYPPMWSKSKQTMSIINNKLNVSMNAKNWQTFQPITFP